MLKIIKITLTLFWFLLFSILYLFPVLQIYTYWWVLINWVFIVRHFKLNSRVSLFLAFILFASAAVILVFNLRNLAEVMMRLSLMMLLVGYLQILIRYNSREEFLGN